MTNTANKINAAGHPTTTRRPGTAWTAVLCWITVLLEGYDLVVLGAIIPILLGTNYLGFTPAGATLAATLSLVGVAVGAAMVGPLSDRFGRRLMLIGSVVLFSVFTLMIPFATSVWMFAVLRLIAGIGLGACMPAALTLMSESLPASLRARSTTFTMTGYHAGAVITSLLALVFTDNWHVLFYSLGVIGLVVAGIMWAKLPESPAYLEARNNPSGARRTPMRELVRPPYVRATLGVWAGSFMGLFLVYGLITWLPQLMSVAGYPLATAVTQMLVLNVGGIVGLLLSGYVADRRGIKGTILIWFAVGGALLALLSIPFTSTVLLNAVVFMTGVFVFSAMVLIYAYVAHFYPTDIRGSALGLASSVGRLGSIMGPAITGGLVTAGIGYPWGFYFFAIVAVLGLFAMLTVPRRPVEAVDASS